MIPSQDCLIGLFLSLFLPESDCNSQPTASPRRYRAAIGSGPGHQGQRAQRLRWPVTMSCLGQGCGPWHVVRGRPQERRRLAQAAPTAMPPRQPAERMMCRTGMMVNAEPTPKPAAVGDHHHAHDTGEQLQPPISPRRACWQCRRGGTAGRHVRKPSLADHGLPPLNRRARQSTGRIAVGQRDAGAFQADRLPEPRRAASTGAADGTILLQSNHQLKALREARAGVPGQVGGRGAGPGVAGAAPRTGRATG